LRGWGRYQETRDWVAGPIQALSFCPAAWRAEAAWRLRAELKGRSEEALAANRREPWAEALYLIAVADYEGVKQGVSDMDAALFSAQRAMAAADLAPGAL